MDSNQQESRERNSMLRRTRKTSQHLHAVIVAARVWLKLFIPRKSLWEQSAAFMQFCPKWVDYLVFWRIFSQVFGDVPQVRFNVLQMLGIIDRIHNGSDLPTSMEIVSHEVPVMSRTMAGDMVEAGTNIWQKAKNGEPINWDELLKSKSELMRLKKSWTIQRHKFDKWSIPEFKIAAAAQENGHVFYADGEDLNRQDLTELCQIACSRIWRMYNEMIAKMDPFAVREVRRENTQQHFDLVSDSVNNVLQEELKRGRRNVNQGNVSAGKVRSGEVGEREVRRDCQPA